MEVYTTAEVAKILKMNRQTVTNMINRGELPAVMICNRWRVRKSDLEEILDPEYKKEEQDESK